MPLSERILGRTTAQDIIDPLSGNMIIAKGELIDEELSLRIEKAGIDAVLIRSVLTCKSSPGICAPAMAAIWRAARS